MKRYETPWHTLTVETVRIIGDGPDRNELNYHTEHPEDCDRLKYGEVCWFDGQFFEYGDEPKEQGVYRARVWNEGPDYAGEWDGGVEWEPVTPEVSS